MCNIFHLNILSKPGKNKSVATTNIEVIQMVFRQWHEEDNRSDTQECCEYKPILAAKTASVEFEATETRDAGCDSCTHYHNGECEIFHNSN
jgi:hypothetical protein